MSKRRAGFTKEEWRCLSGLADPYTALSVEIGVPKVVLQEQVGGEWARKIGHGVGKTAGRAWYGGPPKPERQHPTLSPPSSSGVSSPGTEKDSGDVGDEAGEAAKKAKAAAKKARKRKLKPAFGTRKVNPALRLARGILKLGPGTAMPLTPGIVRKKKPEAKESILWRAFLDECQVDEGAFAQLVAEAERGDDELADEVLAFEEAFLSWVEALDPALAKAAGSETVKQAKAIAAGDDARLAKILGNVVKLRKRLAGEPDPSKYLRNRGAKEDFERFGIPLEEWSKLAGLSDSYTVEDDVEEDLAQAPTWVQDTADRKAKIKSQWRKLMKRKGTGDLLAKYARTAGEKKK